MPKLKVVLLYGGRSTEYEVSVLSAESVFAALDRGKFFVEKIRIGKDGKWERELKSDEKNLVVFPVLHGPMGEDGTVQGLLELLNLPYVGCGVLASALGMDKEKQKELFQRHRLPVVKFMAIHKSEWLADREEVLLRIEKSFKGRPLLFTKPANAGSSVGVTKIRGIREIRKGIQVAFKYDTKILVEEGLENIREVEVAVLGNGKPAVSGCGEIKPGKDFYDYDAKYNSSKTELLVPAKLKKTTAAKIQKLARKAFQIIDGTGLARADFFISADGSKIWLNELNTLPGFTKVSMYPRLWEASGLSYSALLSQLIELALIRWSEKQKINMLK